MANRKSKNDTRSNVNRNSRIETYRCGTGSTRTITARRDDGSLKASVITQPTTERTTLFVGRGDEQLILTGREARTLYRVLQAHYTNVGKPA